MLLAIDVSNSDMTFGFCEDVPKFDSVYKFAIYPNQTEYDHALKIKSIVDLKHTTRRNRRSCNILCCAGANTPREQGGGNCNRR